MIGSPRPAPRWAPVAVGVVAVAYATAFALLSLQRHRGFFTARFDLGNMTQAVWSGAHGGLLVSSEASGEQLSRLAGHVDPILFVFAPLWRVWPSSQMLLVAQAVAVATSAVPAYLLARRWIGTPSVAVAFAAVVLLAPATQWAVLFDFHPVTLAIPLLLWAVWAAVAQRNPVLIIALVLACATKEQVGLAVMMLGVWMTLALGRRRAGPVVAVCGLLWSAVAIGIIIPHFRSGRGHALADDRYGQIGETLRHILSQERIVFVLALLLPLLLLSLLSPLLAACALPDLALNLLSARHEQYAIEYHYGAVIVPFLVAAAIRGFARLRDRQPALGAPGVAVPALLAGVVLGSWLLGPLPFWRHVPGGSRVRAEQFTLPANVVALREAVAMIPPDAVVSAGNHPGGHLSARRRILTFPVVDDAEWVVVDRTRGDVVDDVDPKAQSDALERLNASGRFTVAFDRDGVIVLRRLVRG